MVRGENRFQRDEKDPFSVSFRGNSGSDIFPFTGVLLSSTPDPGVWTLELGTTTGEWGQQCGLMLLKFNIELSS